jgi:hypothetical protein
MIMPIFQFICELRLVQSQKKLFFNLTRIKTSLKVFSKTIFFNQKFSRHSKFRFRRAADRSKKPRLSAFREEKAARTRRRAKTGRSRSAKSGREKGGRESCKSCGGRKEEKETCFGSSLSQ